MLIQVIASYQEEIADERLDKEGGYISKRDVVLKKLFYLKMV
jgi:hypothetical protein